MNFLRISCADLSSLCGEIVYLHNGKDVSSGAFEKNKKAAFLINLPRRLGAFRASLIVYKENGEEVAELEAKIEDFDLCFDRFFADLSSLSLPVGLYFMKLRLHTVAGEIYGVKSEGRGIRFNDSPDGNAFQFSVVDFEYAAPSKHLGGIIYHIFVDRFYRYGDVPVREDAVMVEGWDGVTPEYPEYPGAYLENNNFFGGTLLGVVEKLDYIKSLGVSLIYLSPIFEAYSNHKYDTANYMKVDDMFGGDDALNLLIKEAKSRGIGIILDGVFNHTGSDSIYFNKKGRYPTKGAYQSVDSPYYSWYDFKSHPDDYTCWWNVEILPRINPEERSCADYFAGEGGVVEKYTKLGIAGFRLDVADELSDGFIAEIKRTMQKNSADDSLLYGEVWEDASNKIAYGKRKKYYLGNELDGVMNYPFRVGIIDFVRNKRADELRYALTEVMFNMPRRIRDLQMNLLGTHDTERIITVLSGVSAQGKTNEELSVTYLNEDERELGIKRVKLAYTILATLPGIPTVFYGDETGLEGYKDPFNRRPFPWDHIDSDLLEFYRSVGKIRRESEVYSDGDFALVELSDDILAFRRDKEKESYFTVVNNSDSYRTVKFSKHAEDLFAAECALSFSIAPESARIYRTTRKNDLTIV